MLLCLKILLRQNIDPFYSDKMDFIIKQAELGKNYIEEINIKSDAKKIKHYQISKHFCKLSTTYTILINEYQWDYDVIMWKFVT